MRYIKTILESSSYEVLETVAKKWDDFDTELGQAVMKISTGSLKRELMLYAEKRRQAGIPASGRSCLWMFLHRYQLERGQVLHVDYTAIMKWEYRGDVEAYIDSLDNILLGMSSEPEEGLLHALAIPQLRKCREMVPDFVAYDRANDDSEERTTAFMLDIARRNVARRRRSILEENIVAGPKSAILRGKGKGKDDLLRCLPPKVNDAGTNESQQPCPSLCDGQVQVW